MSDDAALLLGWTERRSEAAFASLVSHYANLVYGTALRVLSGNADAAQDVTQAVFIRLAQQATRVNPGMLGAWLYRQAWFAAHKALRQERRRVRREKEAVIMGSLESNQNALWKEVAPHLDHAISKLSAKDQAALVLRFFQQQDLRTVGKALGTTEDSAQKRVSRALEKLRTLLSRQGIPVSVSALSALLVVPSGAAAPAAVITCATQAAVAAGASGTTFAYLLIHTMTATKFKAAFFGSILAVGFVTPLWLQHGELAALRRSNIDLQAQLQTRRENNDLPSGPAAPVTPTQATSGAGQFNEVLRLRGQVAVLRRRIADLEAGAADRASSPTMEQPPIVAENLAFAGYSDPASSLQTYFWSLKHGDTNALLKAVSPELASIYSQALNGPEPEVIRKSLAAEIADLKAVKIIDTHVKSPSMVVLTIQGNRQQGTPLLDHLPED